MIPFITATVMAVVEVIIVIVEVLVMIVGGVSVDS